MAEQDQSNRLFVALDLSEALQERIAQRRPEIRSLRWIAPERLHLTLAFIGALTTPQMRKLNEALEQVRFTPFELELDRLGTFGHRTLWLGCDPGSSILSLHRNTNSALEALGIPIDERPYQPHITLAYSRERIPEHTMTQLESDLLPAPMTMQVDQFALKNSVLNGGCAPLHQVIRLYNAD